MNQLFFSVVIPTKNRPELLRVAIQSVLLQNFDDYELVISDNFNDERTGKVIDEFKHNVHVSCFRTKSELSMPDHWEWATKKARGKYVLVLPDRAFLRQGALSDVYDSITRSQEDIQVCFWSYSYFDEDRGILLDEPKEEGIRMLNPREVAQNFMRTFNTRYLPRPHVGCYRNDFAKIIRENHGRLCMNIAPDNTASFFFLAYCERIMYIPKPLSIFQGAQYSNAGRATQLNVAPYLDTLKMKEDELFHYVPIKTLLITNLNFNDFLKIRDKAGGNLRSFHIDWVPYFVMNYQELIDKKIFNLNKKEWSVLCAGWERALKGFDAGFQKVVHNQIKRRYWKFILSYIRETFIGEKLARIKRFFLGKPTFKFKSALAAAGFK